MPSGNEQGAHKYRIPGGYTAGGVPKPSSILQKAKPFDEIVLRE